MALAAIKKSWTIRETHHKVWFEKHFTLSKIDSVILKILECKGDEIEVLEFGTALGFTIDPNAKYYDPAENSILKLLLQSLEEFHLVTFSNMRIVTSELGKESRIIGVKKKFYEGRINLYDHHLMRFEDENSRVFNFAKFGEFSKISNVKEVTPFDAAPEGWGLAIAKLNFKEDGDERIEIVQIEKEPLLVKAKTLLLDLALESLNGNHELVTFINGIPAPEFDNLLRYKGNSDLNKTLLLSLQCEYYMHSSMEIDATGIRPFIDVMNWQRCLSDKRVKWNHELLTLLANEDITEIAIWKSVIKYCPEKVIVSSLDDFRPFWDWALLSERLPPNYITSHVNEYPWDLDEVVSRINTDELQGLLLKIEDATTIQAWQEITDRLPIDFIANHVHVLPFDLYSLIRRREDVVSTIVLENLNLQWDWMHVNSAWSIDFFAQNFTILRGFLDCEIILKRSVKERQAFLHLSKYPELKDFIVSTLNRTGFRIGRHDDVLFDSEVMAFLATNNLLYWGDGDFVGVEANPRLIWESKTFEAYSSFVKTKEGFVNVSSSISSLKVISRYKTFPWSYEIISARSDLDWVMSFINENKAELLFSSIVQVIPTGIIFDNIKFFHEWSVDAGDSNFISRYVSRNFQYVEVLKCCGVLKEWNAVIEWHSILARQPSSYQQVFKDISALMGTLPSEKNLLDCLSNECDIALMLGNLRFPWNWEIVTKRFSEIDLKDEDFQIQYADKIYWPYVIDNFYSEEELLITERLATLAALLTSTDNVVREASWKLITRKIRYERLWKIINDTKTFDVFNWDWEYISSLKKLPMDYSFLDTNADRINWRILSSNVLLAHYFQFNESVYPDRTEWYNYVVGYLRRYERHWDFNALSSINALTGSIKIVSEFEERWDWASICANSPLLLSFNGVKKEFDLKRLQRFESRLDFQALSKRDEVVLKCAVVKYFINRDWNWSYLSSHPNFELNKEFLIANIDKPWDYCLLSTNKQLQITKDLILELCDKPWDFKMLSSAKWIDNEVILQLKDKSWDWRALSENANLIFDLNLIRTFTSFSDSHWHSILQNSSLHLTPQTMEILSNIETEFDKWFLISIHPNLDFRAFPLLLDEYSDSWNWDALISENKIPFEKIEVLSKYSKRINWQLFSKLDGLFANSHVLVKFKDLLDWKILTAKLKIGIEEIRLFKNHVDWQVLSQSHSIPFTCELIDEFKHYWDYYYLRVNVSISIEVRDYIEQIVKENPGLQFYIKIKEQETAWSGYIYHFTHITNAIEIISKRKIQSRNRVAGFADAAGDVVSRRHTAHDFARFYFRPQTPTQYYNECLGSDIDHRSYEGALRLGLPKCPVPVFFKFHLQAVVIKLGSRCFASNGNMQTNWAEVKPLGEICGKFNFEDLFSTVSSTSDVKTYINYSQQEFLVKDEFDFSEMNAFEIVVRNEIDRDELVRRFADEPDIVNKIVVAHDQQIFHNQNKDIRCNYENGELIASTGYKGNGIKAGQLIVEFPEGTKYDVLGGNILRTTNCSIHAYPNMNIRFSAKTPVKVSFQDDTKDVKWSLYNFA